MMFKLFKRQVPESTGQSDGKDRIAGAIATRFLRLQVGWAKWMQRHFEGFSLFGKKLWLFGLVALMGGYSGFLIVQGFFAKDISSKDHTSSGSITFNQPFREKQHLDEDTALFHRLKNFSRYMDSLELTTEGRIVKEKILQAHPGLMDSLHVLIKTYPQKQ
ncbi:hypothetical protein [Pedobacter sp. HMWF019]|uniref:hypothetical protein n=1 Tax=Pedobacter sp. HMWF019 TaxID=2056856 RepID=UPI0011B2826C|nr:hypothetical protein [Pedobacter sp. HMWF019]